MSPKRPPRFHLNVALCLAAMTAVAALIRWWAGLSPLTALVVAFAARAAPARRSDDAACR